MFTYRDPSAMYFWRKTTGVLTWFIVVLGVGVVLETKGRKRDPRLPFWRKTKTICAQFMNGREYSRRGPQAPLPFAIPTSRSWFPKIFRWTCRRKNSQNEITHSILKKNQQQLSTPHRKTSPRAAPLDLTTQKEEEMP